MNNSYSSRGEIQRFLLWEKGGILRKYAGSCSLINDWSLVMSGKRDSFVLIFFPISSHSCLFFSFDFLFDKLIDIASLRCNDVFLYMKMRSIVGESATASH